MSSAIHLAYKVVARTLLIPKARPDILLVQVGSNANIDTGAAQESSGRSQIRVFRLSDLEIESKPYTTGELLSYGIRNNVGIAETPKGGIVSILALFSNLASD